ncbi:MAG: formaldehyde-activating enzyme [Gammaproteobacteria bacterium]|nr:formaldehyde-activating enzyme [Gammaproteobacteria bacterium]
MSKGQYRLIRQNESDQKRNTTAGLDLAIADAVLDSVIEGVIPKEHADDLCIVAMIWISPDVASNPNVDRNDLYRTNCEAMKLAISRAMIVSPSIDELIENRNKIHHEMYNPETGESLW